MPDAPSYERPPAHRRGALELAGRDPVIASLHRDFGAPRLARRTETPFAALAGSIIYQQLAGRAAATIHSRLVAALGGVVEPEVLLALDDETLRAAGVSRNKALALRDLATRCASGSLDLSPGRLRRAGDAEIVEMLSEVRGIGRWTAEMFLIFDLRRLDVWPVGDLGVRKGYSIGWGIEMPSVRELEQLGEAFRPYRSIAAWYCWRACERARLPA